MTANTSVHIFFLSVIKKITIKLNQTMWWCATTLWGQSDDYCVVTTACQGQDPALKLTITKISMVVSCTHKHTHRLTLAVACNLLTHWSAFTDVYLLIPPILNSIHHHCQSGGGVCVWVWGWGCHIECWEMCWGMIFRCIKIKNKDSGLRCVVCLLLNVKVSRMRTFLKSQEGFTDWNSWIWNWLGIFYVLWQSM